jgi:hypothetical protein
VLAGPQQDVGGGVAVDQVEGRLDGVDSADLLGCLELVDAVVGQPGRADLALAPEVGAGKPSAIHHCCRAYPVRERHDAFSL